MIITDLVDLGLAVAFAVVALAIAAVLRLRTKAAARRDNQDHQRPAGDSGREKSL